MSDPLIYLVKRKRDSDNSTDLQEYLIVCRTPDWTMKDQIREGIEVYQALKKLLKEKGFSVNVGYEGAYAPTGISTNAEPFELISEAIVKAGYKPGYDIALALDSAASETFHGGVYELARENKKLNSKYSSLFFLIESIALSSASLKSPIPSLNRLIISFARSSAVLRSSLSRVST